MRLRFLMWKFIHIFSLIGELLLVKVGIAKAVGSNNVTYYEMPYTWKSAAMFCQDKGGNLAYDLSSMNIVHDGSSVWTGGYKFYKWKIMFGCYEIRNKMADTQDDHMSLATCQRQCLDFNFFSVKGANCLCLHRNMIGNAVKFTDCNDEDYYYEVYKHNIDHLILSSCVSDEHNCLSVECSHYNSVSKICSADCFKPFKIICDHGGKPHFDGIINGISGKCSKSFIKWIENACEYIEASDSDYRGQYWTSGSRALLMNNIIGQDISALQPEVCLSAALDSGVWVMDSIDCLTHLPFYCIYDFSATTVQITPDLNTTTVLGGTTLQETFTVTSDTSGFNTKDDHMLLSTSSGSTRFSTKDDLTLPSTSSQATTGNLTEKRQITGNSKTHLGATIGGVISSMIIITVIIIVVVVKRRRLVSKDHKTPLDNNQYVYSNVDPNQIQQRPFSVANQSYDHINDGLFTSSKKPQHNGTMLSPNYELAEDAIKIKNGMVPGPNNEIGNDISTANTPDNYDFAQPISNENDYVYNSDYDHLNKIFKAKTESDYALTCPKIQYERDSKTYDTFASSDGQQAGSDYDHLPTNIGSDPTYDCAALKSRKQEENNYDSFNEH